MPKTPSRMSKKKKFNSRFPPARIKKIMQTDEDVGKVAATVPIIISRALELFIESLIKETSQTTIAKNAKTLSTSHIKQTIHSNKQFDFLRDLVANIPDHNTEENVSNANGNSTGDTTQDNGDIHTKKKRGRPRKIKEDLVIDRKKQGESSKASPETSEDEQEDEDEEETESEDEAKNEKPSVTLPNHTDRSLPSSSAGSNDWQQTTELIPMQIPIQIPMQSMPLRSSLMTTTGPQQYPTQFPQGYSVPAPASLIKQQQQLQLPQQMIALPQQHSMGSTQPFSSLAHSYLPPTPLTTANPSPFTNVLPSGNVEGYPIPPQLHHSPYYPMAVPMMPPAHHHPLPPGVPAYQGVAHHMPASMPASLPAPLPAPLPLASSSQAQVQPINLSMSSQRGPHPRDQADDYDS
ncbi:DR1-associated corepressor-like [Elysia marginata]|uniref:Dr1-associated corepressor n=1 Tax=Elysia marginata TaxID=1093978 RepID=A0AAV4J9B4_9GAST|nr:DR1-associated corepressor-like [Elysia marginata]